MKLSEALFDYGIEQEAVDYRLHVCPLDGAVYCYTRGSGLRALEWARENLEEKGVRIGDRLTASGYAVPVGRIEGCRRTEIPSLMLGRLRFSVEDDRDLLGDKAEWLAAKMIEAGLLVFPVEVSREESREQQIAGVDLRVHMSFRVQVKCDFRGGVTQTGNLFLQTQERR